MSRPFRDLRKKLPIKTQKKSSEKNGRDDCGHALI